MSDLHNGVMFTEATRAAAESTKTVAEQYGIDLDSKEMREAMAEMFKHGMAYVVQVIGEQDV